MGHEINDRRPVRNGWVLGVNRFRKIGAKRGECRPFLNCSIYAATIGGQAHVVTYLAFPWLHLRVEMYAAYDKLCISIKHSLI